MNKYTALLALGALASLNSQAMQPKQTLDLDVKAKEILNNLHNNENAEQVLNLGLTAGAIGTATGISAGIITYKLLNKLPVVSDLFIGKLCILGIGGTVTWKVGRAATHQSIIEIIKSGLNTTESDTQENTNL